MPGRPRADTSSPPRPLQQRAESDLAFVRRIMERSQQFSAVPGAAGVAMGLTAVAAAALAHGQATSARWLAVWITEAVVACAIGAVGVVRKARRVALPLAAAPARRFALGLVPALLAGGILTVGCVLVHAEALLPALWLACYGVAVLGGGSVSAVPAIPMLGATFLVISALAVGTPAQWGDAWMALAFGGGHLITGVLVARRHGG